MSAKSTVRYSSTNLESNPVSAASPGRSVHEYRNDQALLRRRWPVVTWGNRASGGDSSSVSADLQVGVTQIFSTSSAFAAIKDDGLWWPGAILPTVVIPAL